MTMRWSWLSSSEKTANNVAAADALHYVAGYCIGLDLTIRGPEERCLRKSPDSYCVVGPWMVTADEIDDPNNLNLKITVNGEVPSGFQYEAHDSQRAPAHRVRVVVLHVAAR